MNLLLIDNGTKHLRLFRSLIPDAAITVRKPENLNSREIADYDIVILTGSSVNSVVGHEDHYRSELELIKSATVPVIGICLGFELIAQAFGAPINRLQKKIEGWEKISASGSHSFLAGRQELTVYEGHRWVVTDLPPVLIGLARSEHGWEIVKHTEKPVYGMQFHPEVSENGHDDGKKIFLEILNTLKLEMFL